jgi:hypothetical protein
MENEQEAPIKRSWYKKKRYLIPLGVIVLFIIIGATGGDPKPANTNHVQGAEQAAKVEQKTDEAIQAPAKLEIQSSEVKEEKVESTSLPAANTNTYSTPYGTPYKTPYTTPYETPYATPAQNTPTALCKDGTLSYSAHRSGTCSHHGGVAQWY